MGSSLQPTNLRTVSRMPLSGGECPLYHERQIWRLCAVHTVNNLVQEGRHTQEEFERACDSLLEEECRATGSNRPVFNPYRSWLGGGDYDLSVIEKVLRQDGLRLERFDLRNHVSEAVKRAEAVPFGQNRSNGRRVAGMILNLRRVGIWHSLFGLRNSRHWVALRGEWQDDRSWKWVDFDSLLDYPSAFKSEKSLVEHLSMLHENNDLQIFLVFPLKE